MSVRLTMTSQQTNMRYSEGHETFIQWSTIEMEWASKMPYLGKVLFLERRVRVTAVFLLQQNNFFMTSSS